MFRLIVVLLTAVLSFGVLTGVPRFGMAGEAIVQTAFSDWSVECAAGCKLLPNRASSTIDPEQFKIIVVWRKSAGTSFALMSVPIGVYLASGILISVDGKRPYKALYELCDQTACHAGFKLSGAVLEAFKRGRSATIRIWLKKDRIVEFPVSLKGFTQAYADFQAQGER
ncbi:Invasion protein IalB, involved in pathogenesis [Pseudovibrio ascidiaceicola]|uniref:Invasion protein IalB, involved in pathogenesis n=1 Tax=Pseudovibrio ascidiaceicola TaxID=285279 RepID=A0A1I4FJ80_9HYPH|nr:invasion associated locus B family protein [Pseudovibrio ascidiaceicola]SFL17984.1 Invasion protein IalB, involved in pathogenesis [Pseudovibrio ascidiaceicola]